MISCCSWKLFSIFVIGVFFTLLTVTLLKVFDQFNGSSSATGDPRSSSSLRQFFNGDLKNQVLEVNPLDIQNNTGPYLIQGPSLDSLLGYGDSSSALTSSLAQFKESSRLDQSHLKLGSNNLNDTNLLNHLLKNSYEETSTQSLGTSINSINYHQILELLPQLQGTQLVPSQLPGSTLQSQTVLSDSNTRQILELLLQNRSTQPTPGPLLSNVGSHSQPQHGLPTVNNQLLNLVQSELSSLQSHTVSPSSNDYQILNLLPQFGSTQPVPSPLVSNVFGSPSQSQTGLSTSNDQLLNLLQSELSPLQSQTISPSSNDDQKFKLLSQFVNTQPAPNPEVSNAFGSPLQSENGLPNGNDYLLNLVHSVVTPSPNSVSFPDTQSEISIIFENEVPNLHVEGCKLTFQALVYNAYKEYLKLASFPSCQYQQPFMQPFIQLPFKIEFGEEKVKKPSLNPILLKFLWLLLQKQQKPTPPPSIIPPPPAIVQAIPPTPLQYLLTLLNLLNSQKHRQNNQYLINLLHNIIRKRILESHDNNLMNFQNSKVVELVYKLKNDQPSYYVKYLVPYQQFVQKLYELLLNKPYLKNNRDLLLKELLVFALSNKGLSTELNGVPKDSLIQSVSSLGMIMPLDVKVLNTNSVLSEQLKVLSDLNSELSSSSSSSNWDLANQNANVPGTSGFILLEDLLKQNVGSLDNVSLSILLSTLSGKNAGDASLNTPYLSSQNTGNLDSAALNSWSSFISQNSGQVRRSASGSPTPVDVSKQ